METVDLFIKTCLLLLNTFMLLFIFLIERMSPSSFDSYWDYQVLHS